ncbi:hypothetical protein [Streptomyces sp. TBY4]|uniref:hypothetical protein n=1 Tax=Streptomyces sp. TBY4 TaxID=2962030 RepID=UPI0020B862C7|nr:hypothetical protein [Streptomyces sp. TBY4]MCP3758196.1 hypothetical protein [Streptomyces sp. TBY4]
MTNPVPDAVVQRRALVAELTRDKKSLRDIAKTLGVSKDVVRRDRIANAATPTARQARLRDKASQAAAAMEQLRDAVDATAAARPAHQVLVTDETAREWLAQLRADITVLTVVAESFRDMYPHLADAPATPDA